MLLWKIIQREYRLVTDLNRDKNLLINMWLQGKGAMEVVGKLKIAVFQCYWNIYSSGIEIIV